MLLSPLQSGTVCNCLLMLPPLPSGFCFRVPIRFPLAAAGSSLLRPRAAQIFQNIRKSNLVFQTKKQKTNFAFTKQKTNFAFTKQKIKKRNKAFAS
ncbi:hypothetical protein [Methanimicrococcus hongohii]|uniref:hypothetical protein n=1 Tax=Methanimicrococcus hongohii TaxID=3028295 RepID=UPI00292ED83E|nr:hypothetical protein [Methanimicrococcus sp. Hf6]